MNIILLGSQGSGKGTQAAMLAKKTGMCWVSIGELLRKEADKNTERGIQIKKILAEGHLVPTELTICILEEHLKQCKEGIILDGFPRTLDQAEALDEMMQVDHVIELKISDDEAVLRLSSRTQCKNNHIYGLNKKPKKKGICEVDGENLFVREDDKPEAIRARLKIYHEETEPLLEFYRPRKIVHSVDASKSPEEVLALILAIVK